MLRCFDSRVFVGSGLSLWFLVGSSQLGALVGFLKGIYKGFCGDYCKGLSSGLGCREWENRL